MGHNLPQFMVLWAGLCLDVMQPNPGGPLAANGLAKVDDRKVFITTVYD